MLEDAQRGTKGSSKKGEAKNDPELWGNALSHSAAGGLEKTHRNGDCAQKTEGKVQNVGAVGPRHFVRQ